MLHSSCFDRKSLSFRSSFTPLGDLNESDLRAGGYILIFCHRRPAEERATAVLPSYHTPQPTNNSNNRQTTATTVVEDAQGPTGLTQTAAVSSGRAFISQDVNKTTGERIGDRGRSPAVQRTSRATSIAPMVTQGGVRVNAVKTVVVDEVDACLGKGASTRWGAPAAERCTSCCRDT